MLKCRVDPILYRYPYWHWFWYDLCYFESRELNSTNLVERVENAALLAELHTRQDIYCFAHGRQISVDGKCPKLTHNTLIEVKRDLQALGLIT